MNCAACGHSIDLHGRRGAGACRHGSASPLAVAVEVVRRAVAAGLSKEERTELVDRAFKEAPAPCKCKRFRKTAAQKASGQ
jgi:hypothetical protein